MACVAVASLVRTIELEFLQYHPRPLVLHNHLISFNKELIQSFHQKLGFLISQLDEERINGVEAVKHLETKLRDLAFRVEDEIEFLVAHLYDIEEEDDVGIADLVLKEEKPQRDTDAEKATQPCVKLGQNFQTAMEEIEAIKEELLKIKNRDEVEERKTAHDVLQRSEVVSSQAQMVGKNDEFEIIKKLLTELGSKEKKVVSIIGMGGIGKTTLARQVYEDPSISIHFDVRAWVVASQLHNKRQMLIGLLNSISKQGNLEKSTNEDLALKLYQYLKRQRYMVVVDDVWSGEAWDDVSNCFPDDGNGSRVLLTTRLAEVANYSSSNSDFSHHMQLLDQRDSWDLFCEKAGKFCGAEFEIIGRPIVEKCKGLPLAIIVVAGLFSKLCTLNEWENVAKALDSSTTTTIAATCSKILSLSYNHLPHHLKACFLYLGVFPEDYAINANELVRLWSAEGLVKTSENENFDVVADRHIQELMDRNLILVSKWSCCGRKIKVFGVHDLLHAFCVKEAQKENLLHVVRENGSDFPQRCFRWVSIQSSNFDVSTLCYSSRSCRSFFCFSDNDISLNWEQFKLLRVFFFTSYLMYKNIVDFVHLRYLPPALDNQNIVKLFKAWNLQTLSICADDRNYLEFPQLQYFACLFMRGQSPKFVHQNLQCLSWLKPMRCTKEFFTLVPNVKKIRISGERRECNDCIENLVNLQQLERLYINANQWHFTSPNIVQINSHIALLKSLKRLRFQSNRFEWNGINVLCKLPRLEVLKLSGACVGKQWELPEDDKFCQLIVLKIGSTDLKDWEATGDHFPKLEHLSLFSCKKLKEIPSGFAEISKLKSIQLADCRPSVVASAEEIKEEQLDYLNNIVDVVVAERRGYSAYTRVSKPESDEYESDEA
ncbi:putative late blight resistance protein homolog R1A-10 isoform X1 [Ipomoea triloba]|uniref:putative late blight resistance protein homolog R1A-10 isoform X1 n=1 Tax=Ipomoea triloba TaxID=35885 RepID=UPI00125D955F|nr:putative late blight resistance protein homolog R1A-10 isoform X1 [Ipomoea triloba]